MRRGGKSEAGSGSIWLPRWSDLLNHLVTGSIPYTYHGRHENNKGFFLPRVITPPKRMFTRSTISPPLFVAPPLALRFSYLYDYILLNCSKGKLIQLERENSRWRKTEERRGGGGRRNFTNRTVIMLNLRLRHGTLRDDNRLRKLNKGGGGGKRGRERSDSRRGTIKGEGRGTWIRARDRSRALCSQAQRAATSSMRTVVIICHPVHRATYA